MNPVEGVETFLPPALFPRIIRLGEKTGDNQVAAVAAAKISKLKIFSREHLKERMCITSVGLPSTTLTLSCVDAGYLGRDSEYLLDRDDRTNTLLS